MCTRYVPTAFRSRITISTQGFDIGEELGFYAGCITTWQRASQQVCCSAVYGSAIAQQCMNPARFPPPWTFPNACTGTCSSCKASSTAFHSTTHR